MSRRKHLTLALPVLALVLGAAPAHAYLTPEQLGRVGASPAPGIQLPQETRFEDEAGRRITLREALGARPAVLVLADYDCRELCGPILAVVAQALTGTGLRAGQDYALVVAGLNPAATPADATRMRAAELGGNPDLAANAHTLTGPPEAVAALERALNYNAVFDAGAGRFAHPADIFVLTPAGTLSRVLPGLAVEPGQLRLALVEAGQGRIGSLADRVHLFCYGLDPAAGVATPAVQALLFGGGAVTLGALAVLLTRLKPRADRLGGSA